MRAKRYAAAIGTATAICVGALVPAAEAGTVCNEAENSHRGGYVVTGGIVDPVPPAFLRGSQMSVGNGGVGINQRRGSLAGAPPVRGRGRRRNHLSPSTWGRRGQPVSDGRPRRGPALHRCRPKAG